MNTPIFHNKDNSLTVYALRCGYIEEAEKDNIRITLEWDSCCYAIKAYNHNNHTRLAWDNADTVKEARKIYKQLIRTYHAK